MPTLVYDDACGPCSRFKGLVDFLDPKGTIRFLGLDLADRRGALSGVDPGARRRSFHLLRDGEAMSGAAALPALARLLPGGPLTSRALASCLPLSHAASFAYGTLSRLHDRGSCTTR